MNFTYHNDDTHFNVIVKKARAKTKNSQRYVQNKCVGRTDGRTDGRTYGRTYAIIAPGPLLRESLHSSDTLSQLQVNIHLRQSSYDTLLNSDASRCLKLPLVQGTDQRKFQAPFTYWYLVHMDEPSHRITHMLKCL